MSRTSHSVSVLLEVTEAYSKASGYKMNWHKSEAMPVSQTCSPNLVSALNFGLYEIFGDKMNPDISEIITTNIEKLLNEIRVDLENWSKLHLTLWGKVDTIDSCSPTDKFLPGMIPVCIPQQLLL